MERASSGIIICRKRNDVNFLDLFRHDRDLTARSSEVKGAVRHLLALDGTLSVMMGYRILYVINKKFQKLHI